jgi:hypothetical protein
MNTVRSPRNMPPHELSRQTDARPERSTGAAVRGIEAAAGWPELTTREFAALQGVTAETVQCWIARGEVAVRRTSAGSVRVLERRVVQQRVACDGWPGQPCGAHRDLALMPACPICGCRAGSGHHRRLLQCAGTLGRRSPHPQPHRGRRLHLRRHRDRIAQHAARPPPLRIATPATGEHPFAASGPRATLAAPVPDCLKAGDSAEEEESVGQEPDPQEEWAPTPRDEPPPVAPGELLPGDEPKPIDDVPVPPLTDPDETLGG